MLMNASGIRRHIGDLHLSPNALHVLDRHVCVVLDKAKALTLENNRRRIDGVIMRRCIL